MKPIKLRRHLIPMNKYRTKSWVPIKSFWRGITQILVMFLFAATTGFAGEKSNVNSPVCHDVNLFQKSVSIFLENEIKPIILLSPNESPYVINAQLIEDTKQQKACALTLSNDRLISGDHKEDASCKISKMSVTLGGLHSRLAELASCASGSCAHDDIAIHHEVINLQYNRLETLLQSCGS